jgi:HAD superfamily hydrolase (TIGR01509 family)
MIGAVLFDVDGTLVDSNDLHAAAWQQAFRHFGITLSFDRIRAQIGKGGDNLIPTLLPRDASERLHTEIEDFRSDLFRRDYLPKAHPFPEVCALLRTIRDDGRQIVLATSAKQAELDFHVDRMGCGDLVTAATTNDDVEHSKPCPDIFEAALAKVAPLGPDEVVVVGDTPWDVKAAARIGIRAIAVRCGGFPEEELRRAGAAEIYDGPKELIARYPEWLGA